MMTMELVVTYDLRTHNGCITMSNPASGRHRTIRVKTVRKGKLEGKRLIELMTGTDNQRDYTAFGFVNPDGSVSIWRRMQQPDRYYETLADMVKRPDYWQTEKGVVYQFEGKCIRCNKPLTNPDSITSGIGPECAKKG